MQVHRAPRVVAALFLLASAGACRREAAPGAATAPASPAPASPAAPTPAATVPPALPSLESGGVQVRHGGLVEGGDGLYAELLVASGRVLVYLYDDTGAALVPATVAGSMQVSLAGAAHAVALTAPAPGDDPAAALAGDASGLVDSFRADLDLIVDGRSQRISLRYFGATGKPGSAAR